MRLSIGRSGTIAAITDLSANTSYLYTKQQSPLLSIRVGGTVFQPSSMQYRQNGIMKLAYNGEVTATIKAVEKQRHITFELVSVEPEEDVELVIWGPYRTTIGGTIGETVGVVRNGSFAFGIQALDVKTLGGYPNEESDVMPSYNIFAGSDYSDIDASQKDKELFRGNTAKPADYGSVLHAYCRSRGEDRVISNWKHDRYVAPAFDDGGVEGSKIALFGCAPEHALETIGVIETAEGLPHPVIDGQWGKTHPEATAAYLIMNFGVDTINQAVAYTKKAGLKYLYHPDPFKIWGHFQLKPKDFPDNIASLKHCVDIAAREGVYLGVHTLSSFITTNDYYVTPVPDKRLARVGSSVLSEAIDETQTDILIEDPGFFNQMENNNLKTVIIGSELIRYGSVTDRAPYTLTGCVRGAFGTKAARHSGGEDIGKLMDHGYKVFLGNAALQKEIAGNIANLFNRTGLRQISFDGLEGCWSSGMGQYSRTLFTKDWYDSLSDDLRGRVITDASNPGHFFWHIYTRMNWGEPWYAGFRESQTQYRLKNQNYFRRNLMPSMLGWFRMTDETSFEDIEWLLARSAGFDAGYALVSGFDAFEYNGMAEEILDTIGRWETARLSGAFSDEQKERLKNIDNEFHLETSGENTWELYPVAVSRFTHEKKTRQPGEPMHTAFSFDNPHGGQPLQFIITVLGGAVENLSIEIDNYLEIKLPARLGKQSVLKYSGGAKAIVYDANWHETASVPVDVSAVTVSEGKHTMKFDCEFIDGDKPSVKIELRITGEPENVASE